MNNTTQLKPYFHHPDKQHTISENDWL